MLVGVEREVRHAPWGAGVPQLDVTVLDGTAQLRWHAGQSSIAALRAKPNAGPIPGLRWRGDRDRSLRAPPRWSRGLCALLAGIAEGLHSGVTIRLAERWRAFQLPAGLRTADVPDYSETVAPSADEKTMAQREIEHRALVGG